MEFMYCYSSSKAPNGSTNKLVQWEKPPSSWTKLNTDGASLGNPGVAGCGGVVRDESGNRMAGFARRIGITSSFKAELWGLRDGLTLCSNLNISALIVELDAEVLLIFFKMLTMRIIFYLPFWMTAGNSCPGLNRSKLSTFITKLISVQTLLLGWVLSRIVVFYL